MKKFLTLVSAAMMAVGAMAQTMTFDGAFTNDAEHTICNDAQIQFTFNNDSKDGLLRLVILPEKGVRMTEAVVDTAWVAGSPYRKAPDEKNDFIEEKDIYYFYHLNTDESLLDYVIIDQLVDKRHPQYNQTVIRKCDANGNRIWCAAFKPGPEGTKEFFKMLQSTVKSLKFKRTDMVKSKLRDFEEDPNDPRVSHPHTGVGRGSAYGSGQR